MEDDLMTHTDIHFEHTVNGANIAVYIIQIRNHIIFGMSSRKPVKFSFSEN